jgi:hypothetical protein
MAEQNIFPYKFNSYDPAIFVEIYLPKKIRHQGVLYKSLRTGFNFGEVKKHLIDQKEFANISEFLEDYKGLYELYQRADTHEIADRVGKMEETFYGFSMYEVNGVFFNKKRFELAKEKAGDKKDEVGISEFIAEENVQFIRMIFKPDVESILAESEIRKESNREGFLRMNSFIKRCMDNYYEVEEQLEREEALEKHLGDTSRMKRVQTKWDIFKKVEKWVDDVALFLFGFLMYKICQEIKDLHKEEGERPEDEIWITSFGNLDVNRITWSITDK